jgi:hypothetical protein
MRERDIGWIAGLLDGDGAIVATKGISASRGAAVYGVQVLVAVVDRPLIDKFAYLVDGKVQTITPPHLNRSTYYRVTLCANRATDLLRLVLDELSPTKQIAAKACIALQESINSIRGGAKWRGIPKDVLAYRESLYRTVKTTVCKVRVKQERIAKYGSTIAPATTKPQDILSQKDDAIV